MSQIPVELWVAAVAFGLAAVLLWLMLTEGSYLGSGWVRRSYDWLAPWYEGKWKSQEYQSRALNQKLFIDPVLKATGNRPNARVLDLACGTGRVGCLLLQEDRFQGKLEAVDFSAGMLKQFRQHLANLETDPQNRVQLSQMDLQHWRCEKPGSYDAVLFLEAAELVPHLPKLLDEIRSALKPGGVLITTRVGPRFIWLFPGRHQRGNSMNQLLADNRFEVIDTIPWRKRYDVVIATGSASKA